MILKCVRAVIVLMLFAAAAKAQSYKILTTADFGGTPQKMNFAAVAYTNCSLSYDYSVRRVRGVFELDFNVKLAMNKHLSWLDMKRIKSPEMLAEVLKHEQGHYAIAYLQQQEVLRTFARTRFGRDYNVVSKEIFFRINEKYTKLNDTYERETNHMQNREQQVKWDKYLSRCLEYLPPIP